MSEIKGQLLGMLLVLAAFATIGTVLYNALSTTANSVGSYVSNGYTWDNVAEDRIDVISYFD